MDGKESPVLGIDVSKETLSIWFQGKSKVFSNSKMGYREIKKWLKSDTAVHACMESTGRYWEGVAENLFEAGHKVSVVAPVCVAGFAKAKLRRSKSDKRDAEVIAQFCQKMEPAEWVPMPLEQRELQDLERTLDALKRSLAQERTRLKSGLRSKTAARAIESHITFLKQEIKLLEKEISKHVKNNKLLCVQFELLTSIVGIGPTTAHTFLGEVGSIAKFENNRQLSAYGGMDAREWSSGSMNKKNRFSKVGNKRLRKALYLPALTAMRCNPIIIKFASRLAAANKPKMLIVGAVMRKLLSIMHGVVKNGVPFDPEYKSKPPLFN